MPPKSRKKPAQTNVPGFGFIYQPTYRGKDGKLRNSAIWWMQYSTDDKPVRRATGRKDQDEAFAELLKMAGKRASGGIRDSAPERVTIGELLDLVIADYRRKGRATLYDLTCRIEKHLRPCFGDMKAIDLKKRDLVEFVNSLRATHAEASINRCLVNLHTALRLGSEEDPPLVLRIPDFPYQDERHNVRNGILEPAAYRRLRDCLAPHARLVLVIGYHTGMRRGEILSLKWEQVDLESATITLGSKQTKNRTARVAPIYGEMGPCLEMAKAERDASYPNCKWVIQYFGVRVYDVKTAWKAGLKRAGLPTALMVHDLRRTALTNMEEAGIPRHVAMGISGHKTENVYRRYLIGGKAAATEAGKKLETYMQNQMPLTKERTQ